MLWENSFIVVILAGICISMLLLVFLLHEEQIRNHSETLFLQISCLAVFVWAFFSFFMYWISDPKTALDLALPRFIGVALMPVALCIHIRNQFFIDKLSRLQVGWCFLPAMVSVIIIVTNPLTGFFYTSGYFPNFSSRLSVFDFNWGFYYHCIISYLACIIGILMLLRIFYLVPKRIRRSINIIIFACLLLTTVNIPVVFNLIHPVIDPSILAAAVALWIFYFVHKKVRSANIIVTSRDYIFNHFSFVILILDRERRVLDFNRNAEIFFKGYDLAHNALKHYDDMHTQWINNEKGRVSPDDPNIVSLLREGKEHHYYISNHELLNKNELIGHLVEISDITRQFTVQRYLENFALYDQLTGLYNRNAYSGQIKLFDDPVYMPLFILMGDINNLKSINDQYGHLVGDKLIQDIAGILRKCMPKDAYIARIGGDEFVILIPKAHDLAVQSLIADVERACGAYDFVYGTPEIALGYAIMYDSEQDFYEAFALADKNMFEKKREMKRSYSEMVIHKNDSHLKTFLDENQ